MHVTLHLNPIPASRVTPRGFHRRPYARWKAAAARILPGAALDAGMAGPMMGPVVVFILCAARRPKHSILDHPLPDVDNFAKAVLDAGNGILWGDDQFIISLHINKSWAPAGDDGYVDIWILPWEANQKDETSRLISPNSCSPSSG